ncbi:MAG: hypothetical protein NVV70_13975 [Cellulomonas sp.]|nr:hypothetical protein [Cellulomonas sp.]MCR6649181.1 hypothetical protein [Cellulomonas sp.]
MVVEYAVAGTWRDLAPDLGVLTGDSRSIGGGPSRQSHVTRDPSIEKVHAASMPHHAQARTSRAPVPLRNARA